MLTLTIFLGLACLIYAFVTDLRGDGLHTPIRSAVALGIGLAIVLAGIGAAHAAEVEASIGASNGMSSSAYSLGITGMISDNLRWRTGFASLGSPTYNRTSSAMASWDDIKAGEGAGPYNWMASKQDQELYATLAPEWHAGNYIFSVEGGLALYRPAVMLDLSAGQSANSAPKISPVFGVSVGYEKTSLVLSVQRFTTFIEHDMLIPNGVADGPTGSEMVGTISIRQRF